MLNRIRRKTIREKGQGLTEYVLILAFIAGIAFMMFGGSGSLKGTLVDTLTETNGTLAGLFSKTYSEYFHEWRDWSSQQLRDISNDERLKADQEALAIIARKFIGLNQTQVGDLIKSLSKNRNGDVQFENSSNYIEGANGWSQTLVPLSYQTNGLDDAQNKHIHLDFNDNVDTVKFLSEDAKAFRGKDKNGNLPPGNIYSTNDAVVADRIFYSDGMILQQGDNATADDKRMVTLQVHYEGGVVDKVRIQARTGNTVTDMKNDDKIVNGLNFEVTKRTIVPASNSN